MRAGGDSPHPIEFLAWSEVERLQCERLSRQADYLRERSPFYRERFKAAGINPGSFRTLADLDRVPLLTKDAIRMGFEGHPPLGPHLSAPLSDVAQIHFSSGTSGRPTYVALTARDRDNWLETFARGFIAGGWRTGDMVVHAFAVSRGYAGGLPMLQAMIHMGAVPLSLGAESGAERILGAVQQLRPVALYATPSMTIYLGEQAEAILGRPARELSIRKVIAGGEPGASQPSVRSRAESLWGAEMREAMGGTDVSALMWTECEARDGMHYMAQEFVVAQLINPETTEPVPIREGAVGELVYTHIDKEATPLFRFRHGDIVQVVGTGPCRCGRTSPRIRCLGRADDMIIVKGAKVYPSAVQEVVASFQPGTTGTFRIQVPKGSGRVVHTALTVLVEHAPGLSPAELEGLERRLIDRCKDLFGARIAVTWVPAGALAERAGVAKINLVEEV